MQSYQVNLTGSELKSTERVAGIHLSGANAHKTAVVLLETDPLNSSGRVVGLYERLGSVGRLFSDERLADILHHEGPFASVFVDCPLSLPPCVACQRSSCPGAIQCDDVSVAYMLSLSRKNGRKIHKKTRSVNPQSQRLWDVMYAAGDGTNKEPTYSANMAPLVTRARTLQRRCYALQPQIELKEMSVVLTMQVLARWLELPEELPIRYRNFEFGLATRRQIIERLVEKRVLIKSTEEDIWESCSRSVENFQALITAITAMWHTRGFSSQRPAHFLDHEGWVYVPSYEALVSAKTP